MTFLRNRTLAQWALYLLGGMVVILLAEYYVLRYRVERLEEIEEKKDYARTIQLSGQQIALLVNDWQNGDTKVAARVLSMLNEQEHRLETLRDGGRIEGTDVIIDGLSRLPRITFDQLFKTWTAYSSHVRKLVTNGPFTQTEETDSTEIAGPVMLPAQWLTLSLWFDRLEADLTEQAVGRKRSVEGWALGFILFDIVFLCLVYWAFRRFVVGPIRDLKSDVRDFRQKEPAFENEIGQVTREVNNLLEQLKDARDFVTSIASGNLDIDYRSLDENHLEGKNALADALITMQNKLKDMSVEEQRRQWANEGLAKFVDILRSSDDNIARLADRIISALVKYTGSNQGGFYVLNDDDENDIHLELVSLFAFDIKKHQRQRLKLGEGLLGQAFLERETTLLTEIPEEYIRITSGLGMANPRALLMVPLKVDETAYGIVELASFRNYEQHEIAFVERLAETIASTVASVKAAQKNRVLIEQFQTQTEQMHAQEEEMRQNMEELQATQEELARKEKDYISAIQELEQKVQDAAGGEELSRLTEELQMQKENYEKEIRDLRAKLDEITNAGGDWSVAEEVAQMLKVQLDAMRITQETTR